MHRLSRTHCLPKKDSKRIKWSQNNLQYNIVRCPRENISEKSNQAPPIFEMGLSEPYSSLSSDILLYSSVNALRLINRTKVNSADPDEAPKKAASNLGLHYFHKTNWYLIII